MRPTSRACRGATLVEFVIVFPLAVLFVLGLIQSGFLYIAKMQVNHATFMAARAGAMNNADSSVIRNTLVKGLNPFYEQGAITNDAQRIDKAALVATAKTLLPGTLSIDILSPSKEAFNDFGLTDPTTRVKYIPNDNLEWRSTALGKSSKVNIRDANLLKLRVVYAYDLKVPLMAGVIKRIMCGGKIGVGAWGNVSALDAEYLPFSQNCLLYYRQGRVPIESFAIVEMQSRAQAK